MNTKLDILITGANGNLGKRLVSRLERVPFADVHIVNRVDGRFDFDKLSEQIDRLGDSKIVFIHLAWNTVDRSHEMQHGCFLQTTKIAELCEKRSIRMMFISSMSVKEKSRSNYGVNKFHAEKEVQKRGGYVIRPGLVLMVPAVGIQKVFQNSALRFINIHFTSPELFVPVILEHDFLESMCEQIFATSVCGAMEMYTEWVPLGQVGSYVQKQNINRFKIRIKTRLLLDALHFLKIFIRKIRELEDSFMALVDINK